MEFRVYSLRLANYLTKRGFSYNSMCQDVIRKERHNWLFTNTPELQKAINEFQPHKRLSKL